MKKIIISLLLLFTVLFSICGVAKTAQVIKDYHESHPGKGKYGHLWNPIAIQKYWNPKDFYTPPTTVKGEFKRQDCINCHQSLTPGAYHAWKNSVHANLDDLNKLPNNDVRAYKKDKLAKITRNLKKAGILGQQEKLSQVSCIDCHGEVGAKSIKHDQDLRMPDRAVCGTCHLSEFIEAESEKDLKWPQKQWDQGHPSHAVSWKANVENGIWAGMAEREIAQGCDMCHYQQNKCDGCHTRHSFSVAEARQPEACSTCHNGVDHNEYENYILSKHGTIYQTQGENNWDFEVQLKDAITKGGYTAPTCQTCHFESDGEYSHNLVKKVRWAFNPTPAIADNLDHPWFEERKEKWIATCMQCHSRSFSKAYLDTADEATKQGLAVEQEAKKIVEKLHKDGLLIGQTTNRPMPPAPEKDVPGGFFQLFWAKGNNPTRVERVYADMWEHDLIKLYKGVFHANPGGFTYTEGWSPLVKGYAEIMDEDTRLREKAALNKRVAELEKPEKKAESGNNIFFYPTRYSINFSWLIHWLFIIEKTGQSLILTSFSYKKAGLFGLTFVLLWSGAQILLNNWNKPQALNLSFQTQKTEQKITTDTHFQIIELLDYQLKKGQTTSFDLTVAKYKNANGESRQATIFSAPDKLKMPVLNQKSLRSRAWQQVNQAINQHIEENSLFISWWDNSQRINLMTGQQTWVSLPVESLYTTADEQQIWSSIAGGFNANSSKIKQLSEWLLMDANLAIKKIKKTLPKDQSTYFLSSIDDLARLQEIQMLTQQKLAIDSRVFYTGDNIHTLISTVKQWAKAEGTGNYLVQPIPGIGIRAWRILDEQSENTLLIRLLPFTHSLEHPLENIQLVFQSEWGSYLSVFKIAG